MTRRAKLCTEGAGPVLSDPASAPARARIRAIGLNRRADRPVPARTIAHTLEAMAIERLTADDEIMLWADDVWPQDIGAVAVVDGQTLFAENGRFRIEAIQEMLAARIQRVPRFRQVLLIPPRRLGGPLWVDCRDFDVTRHIRVAPIPSPGDEAQLLLTVEQLRRRRLDRSRPLWEMWFLRGLAKQRVGVFMRTHHALADGMAGLATLASFLDFEPDASVPAPPSWTPAQRPSDDELARDQSQREKVKPGRTLSALAHPLRSMRGLAAVWPALRELVGEEALRPTSLTRIVGPGRNLALVRSRIDPCKMAAHLHGAKVNDVLLASIAGGLRDLFKSRGEAISGGVVRIYVPVTLRHAGDGQPGGNAIAQMMVPLPVGVDDPVRRLRLIAAETGRRKSRTRPPVGGMPHGGFVGRAFLKLIDRQRVNVCSADLPGPAMPLYVAGAEVLELFPLLPLIGKVSIGVGAISYAGQLDIMVTADSEVAPDIEVLAAGIQRELDALTRSVEPGRIVA